MADPTREELLELVSQLVEVSGGRLRLAHNEYDKSRKIAKDAAHFLKLDEKRLGRDIELYGFMGAEIMGWQEALVLFLEEVVLPLKNTVPSAYNKASESLIEIGKRVYSTELLAKWEELFV
jgi:hypothetical protein